MAKLGQIKSGTMRVGNTTASGYGIVYADEIIGHRRVNTYAELKALPVWCLYNKAGGDNINTAIGQLWYVSNGDSSHPAGLYQLIGTDISLDASWKFFKNGADVHTTNTTYTFANGQNGTFTVTPSGGSAQTVSIGKPATAGTADHAKTADSATKADSATSATNASHATRADSATSATKATQDADGNNIASTYATKSQVSALSSALVYRGTVDAKYALPTKNVKIGDVYVVAAAGIFAGQTCEAGDMIIAQTASNAEGTPAPTWTVVQTNINGAVTTTDTLTESKLIVGGGNRTIKAATGTGFVKISNGAVSVDNSTYLKSVPAATDTSVGGIKAENIGTLQPGFTVTEQNQVIDRFTSTTSPSNKIYPVELFYNGRAFVRVPWTDTNTTYPLASASANGLMSSNDKKKLDTLQNYTLQVASDNVLGGIKAVKTNKTLGAAQLQDNITDITGRYYPVLMVNSDKACVNVPWIDPKSYIDFEFNDTSKNAISNSTVTEAINGLKSDINGVVASITSISESEITKLFN